MTHGQLKHLIKEEIRLQLEDDEISSLTEAELREEIIKVLIEEGFLDKAKELKQKFSQSRTGQALKRGATAVGSGISQAAKSKVGKSVGRVAGTVAAKAGTAALTGAGAAGGAIAKGAIDAKGKMADRKAKAAPKKIKAAFDVYYQKVGKEITDLENYMGKELDMGGKRLPEISAALLKDKNDRFKLLGKSLGSVHKVLSSLKKQTDAIK